MPKPDIKGLFYITHVNNIDSILRHGILSHALVEERKVEFTPIYDAQIVSNRRARKTPNGKSLWDYANLYFQPRNPMLYRVINEKDKKDIAIVGVRPDVLKQRNAFVSTGNAASGPSDILPVKDGLKAIYQMWKVINSEWWNDTDGSKRKIMAECLVPELVPPDLIQAIYVTSHPVADKLRSDLRSNIPVIPEPHMFFLPTWRSSVTPHMSLVEGDMFFSTMQTLTVSVNTVGIMGKGLASRAKYQFPDVYVIYQDACRSKKLQMGKPYLYKREAFVDEELADEPSSLTTPNSTKWFLLFATKKHWRENSDIAGIEQGLQWVKDKYKTQGIESLAVPALGCGLGGLDWKDVGPLICQYLVTLDIPVAIYLPREKEISREYLTSEFLVGK
jgi:O-acetyl-ADP-ribose deacetylase (regulator of RNase III)